MAIKRNTTFAVLTGDIIDSSLLSAAEKRKMLKVLNSVLLQGKQILSDWEPEIFQGDSFQGATEKGLPQSLRYALIIITSLKKYNINTRVAIGIGDITFSSGKVSTSNGAAFQYSGRSLEEMKKNTGSFISIHSANEDACREWEVHCTALNYLMMRCTPLQAEALQLALESMTQVEIAKKLKIKQPTVQQRLQAAGWPVFKAVLQRFESKY
jgi:hypothetical protein